MTDNKRQKSLIGSLISDDNNKKAIANSIQPKETRSARIALKVKPSTKQKALDKIEASGSGLSLNEVINQLLENWIDE